MPASCRPHFLPRPDVLAGLRETLLATNGGAIGVTGVAATVGVQGMGGIVGAGGGAGTRRRGAERVSRRRVLGAARARRRNSSTRQADLYWLLTGEKGAFADAQQGRIALQEALRGRACLVVLDDVWRLADTEAFNVADAGARLLLTRDAAIGKGIGAREHEVARLDRPASRRLLVQTAGVAEADLPAAVDQIAAECGDLPLALALAGGMIDGQVEMLGPVLDALRKADLHSPRDPKRARHGARLQVPQPQRPVRRARKRAPPVRQQRDRADPISRSANIAATLRPASTPPSRARRLDSVTSVGRWPNPPGRLKLEGFDRAERSPEEPGPVRRSGRHGSAVLRPYCALTAVLVFAAPRCHYP